MSDQTEEPTGASSREKATTGGVHSGPGGPGDPGGPDGPHDPGGSDAGAHDIEALEHDFLDHLWPPFTQMRGLAPIVMESAEGCVVRDVHGNEYLDAFASLWTVNVGHGRTEIHDAIRSQADEVACYHMFGIANPPSIKLAAKVAGLLPGDLDHVFLCLGGGEAVETALKMARQYWRNRGQGTKYMVFYRDRSYHGTTFGATSIQGLGLNRQKFEPLLPGFIRLGAPYCYRCPWGKTYGHDCAMECAKVVEQELAFYGAENVGTLIGETMIGTGGVIPPPDEYWPMVNEICKANDVLVINDEVITGFGRTGSWFGFERWGSDPDLVTMAKGLASGYLPLAAVAARDHVYEAFLGPAAEMKQFMSGATFQGHPLCSAAGLANLEIIEREKLVERCAELGPYLQEGLRTLLKHPIVGDVRGVGMVAGVEFVTDKETKEWFPATGLGAAKVRDAAFERGVFVRLLAGGHVLGIAPPFVINKGQIDTIVRVMDESIGAVERQMGY